MEGADLKMFVRDPLGAESTRGGTNKGAVNDGVNSREVPFQGIILAESTDLIRPTLEGRNDKQAQCDQLLPPR